MGTSGFGNNGTGPLVTVVIPSHNRGQLVLRALESVERQTYRPLEVVVVDDASDAPLENLASAAGTLDVRLVRRDVRGGAGAARNTSAPFVRGDYVSFLDSDDEWVPTKIERQVERLVSLGNTQGPRMLVCGFQRSTGAKRWVVAPRNGRIYTRTSLLAGSTGPLTASVMMIDADPFRSGQLRFDEELPALEDLDLAIQVAGIGTVVCQEEVLTLKYRDHDREHAYTHDADIESRRTLASKYEHILDSNKRARMGFETRRVVGLIAAGMDDEAASVALASGRNAGLLGRAASRVTAVAIRTPARQVVRAVGRILLRAQRAADRTGHNAQTGRATRVAFVLPNLEVGGVQRAHLLIGRYLSENVEPLFVSLHAKDNDSRPSLQATFEAAGLQVHDLGLRKRADQSPWALALGAWRLRRLCRAERVDIVDSCIVEADLVARLAAIGTRTRQVTHLVSTTYDAAVERRLATRSRLRLSALRRIDAFSGRRTDAFVALTEGVAGSARHHLRINPRKMVVIPRGVDLAEFGAAASAAKPGSIFRVLSIGRLAPSKGHEATINAVASLNQRGIATELVIAGDGPLLRELGQLADELGIASKVTLVGAVDSTGIRRLLSEAHVFCFPSRWEGQGNALLEAMASGRPIVATDIATIREVLGEAGLLVRPEDTAALAEGLREVAEMSLDERSRLSRVARRRAEARFDAADRVRDLENFYRSLMEGNVSVQILANSR